MAKKIAQAKQSAKKVSQAAPADVNNLTITDCNFNGVKFDAAAINAVQRIADGLVANAEALRQLSYVLKASNVTIETMVRIDTKNGVAT